MVIIVIVMSRMQNTHVGPFFSISVQLFLFLKLPQEAVIKNIQKKVEKGQYR